MLTQWRRSCDDEGRDWSDVATVKEFWEPLEAEREDERSTPRNFKGGIALLKPRFHSLALSNYERVSYCCFKPPSLQ